MSVRKVIRWLGAPLTSALGGVVAIVLAALSELVGAGTVTYPVAIPYGLLVGALFALWDKNQQLEEQREKYLPRVSALRVLRVPFNIIGKSYNRQVVTGTAVAFNVVWENNPPESSPKAKGHDLRGYISVFSGGRQLAADVAARWDETDQPEPMKPTAHLAAIDLGIGEQRGMALVVKFPDDRAPYLFTNLSYAEGNLRKPDFRLEGDVFAATVRVRGTNVDAVAEIEITVGTTATDEPTVRILSTKYHLSETSTDLLGA